MKTNIKSFFVFVLFFLSAQPSYAGPDLKEELRKLTNQRDALAKELEATEAQRPNISLTMGSGIVKYHGKKGSGIPFAKDHDPRPVSEPSEQSVDQFQFRAVDFLIELPNCQQSEIKKEELGGVSSDGMSYDYLFYSFLDPDQRERGEAWQGLAIPYYAPKSAEWAEDTVMTNLQFIALQRGVSCLPTRIQIVTEDGQAYLQHKMGLSAWDK